MHEQDQQPAHLVPMTARKAVQLPINVQDVNLQQPKRVEKPWTEPAAVGLDMSQAAYRLLQANFLYRLRQGYHLVGICSFKTYGQQED